MMNFNHLSIINSSTNFKSEYCIVSHDEICDESNSYNCTDLQSRQGIRMMAGLKIFAFIMMHAWSKRRKEIKQLKQSVEELKKSRMRTENQIRIYTTLIRVEQNRNDELTSQLKRTLNNLKQKTASCEITTMKLSNLKMNNALLEQELKNRYQEYDALHEMLTQTKTELFRSMMKQINLQSELCKEQRSVQLLESQKNELIIEICSLKRDQSKMEDLKVEQLNVKFEKLFEANQLTECQSKLIDVQEDFISEDLTNSNKVSKELKTEIQMSNLYDIEPQKRENNPPNRRLAMYWTRFLEYPKHTLHCVHILTCYLLPAMPPPSPKFTFKSDSN